MSYNESFDHLKSVNNILPYQNQPSFKCNICGNIYYSKQDADECQNLPFNKNNTNPANVGDFIVIPLYHNVKPKSIYQVISVDYIKKSTRCPDDFSVTHYHVPLLYIRIVFPFMPYDNIYLTANKNQRVYLKQDMLLKPITEYNKIDIYDYYIQFPSVIQTINNFCHQFPLYNVNKSVE